MHSSNVNADELARYEQLADLPPKAFEIDSNATFDDYAYTEPYQEDYEEYSAFYEPVTSWTETEGLNAFTGVNYHDGRTETYYSSSVLYHYRTPEWSLDDEGFYRDSEGRYVVAASDMEHGTVFQGSKGECIVLDSGCAAGVTDYYVDWL